MKDRYKFITNFQNTKEFDKLYRDIASNAGIEIKIKEAYDRLGVIIPYYKSLHVKHSDVERYNETSNYREFKCRFEELNDHFPFC